MTTATLRLSTPLPSAAKTANKTAKKGRFARFYAAFTEARMRAAMREIQMRRHLIPADVLKNSGYAASANDDSAFPFTR